jgi:predicted N-formylglutamate amidohydrolase
VPPEHARLFAGAAGVLDSHRGLDYGALDVARAFARRLRAPCVAATVTRLLVDLNRSPHHRHVFSEYSRALGAAERAAVMRTYYAPYRLEVERAAMQAARAGALLLHVSSHSFTPRLHGEVRCADVGFLYDPARRIERDFVAAWQAALAERAPRLALRRNYPYRGTADALVTHLRRRYPERAYAGVEIEVNQKLVGTALWPQLVAALAESLGAAVATT